MSIKKLRKKPKKTKPKPKPTATNNKKTTTQKCWEANPSKY